MEHVKIVAREVAAGAIGNRKNPSPGRLDPQNFRSVLGQ